ncbi:membrane protein insertion efficiency factor YidD [Aggregatilinea lenta]|uniref:membrane protein insertion efficiency factor YidD n=1 Tax=Aggregatilinea lenta TaxID=913108 RepID=UPI000E5AB445
MQAACWGATAMKYLGLVLIRVYQQTFSRLLPPSCRYDPSCSHYTYQAIDKYGLFKGSWLGVRRIARCHPLGPGGHDPVP